MSPLNSRSEDTIESAVIGFMGAPGTGKTAAMTVIEDQQNREAIAKELGLDVVSVDVARKATSRENRGADDRLKISGVDPSFFEGEGEENIVGKYVLVNNGAYYAYPKNEFEKGADVLVAEPSIYHLEAVKAHLKDRLRTVMLVASTEYREKRMNGRGTEEQSQVRKRLVEGDVQTFAANVFGGGKLPIEKLINPEIRTLLEKIYKAQGQDANALEEFTTWIANYVSDGSPNESTVKFAKGAAREYGDFIGTLPVKGEDESIVDDIIVLDDSYVSDDFVHEGKFHDEIIDIEKKALKNRKEQVA